MQYYSKEQLIVAIKKYSNVTKKTPTIKEIEKNRNLPPRSQLLKQFKTWNNLIKQCGLKRNKVWGYHKNELLGFLIEYKRKNDNIPKIKDFTGTQELPSSAPYFRNFGSWNNALKQAGLATNKRDRYTKKELINLLKKKASLLGRSPKGYELDRDKRFPSSASYSDHFGTLNKALQKAGLEVQYYNRKWTKEEIIFWLRRKYNELGKTPGIRDFDKDKNAPAKNTVRKLFGNWTKALRESKIPVKRFHSKTELIELMQKLSKKLNKTPTRTDMDNAKGFPSYAPFVIKFGSYTAACLRAGLTPNDGRNNKIWQGWERHCIEMAKAIYEKVSIKSDSLVDGIPDIYIKEKNLFIDAKTCGYKEFREQVKKYCFNGAKLEFWCIFKGMENRSKKVRYVYAEELAKMMKDIGRNDLSSKCYQFIKNIYSEEQTSLA
ncbi:hypothetical protein HYT57_05505 [Candidatus Woesearchaeota archaeon]|nr:hypothetical protein [Candidatus Woesearchaeota archaeon]